MAPFGDKKQHNICQLAMTRKKVKLAFITNDSSRKATFKKRKKGLMKKVSELSTLCGIDSCAIIYSPYETQPEVWPNTIGAQRVLAQFKRMPEMEQSKKMVNQESFIRQRISKANEQLKKLHKDNREKEVTELMYQCLIGKSLQNLTMADLNDLGWLIDQNLKETYKRIEELKKRAEPDQQLVLQPPQQVAAAGVSDHMLLPRGTHGHDPKPAVDLAVDALQRPQWFTEWMMNNPSDQQMGCFGHGDDSIMPFNDNHSAIWSSAFFP